MSKIVEKMIRGCFQGKLLPLLLIFSFGINSLPLQVVDEVTKVKMPKIRTSRFYPANQPQKKKIFDKEGYLLSGNNTFSSFNPGFGAFIGDEEQKINRKIKVVLTAYSSTFLECDKNPFKTASGNYVRDGIVAANFLPFGTKIRIPEIFGNKVFEVEDRMAKRYWYRVDIWMPDYRTALKFGKKYVEIEILD